MKLLVVTNLYPPQELGGYGRSIADFVWGLIQLGHTIHVCCSDAPYLGASSLLGPSGEIVNRDLLLKGSFESGSISIENNQDICRAVNYHNQSILSSISHDSWDGILLGNIDLLGHEILSYLLTFDCLILHHVGFINPPYPYQFFPHHPNYYIVSASHVVRSSLCSLNFPISASPVIYPGVRLDYFSEHLQSISPSLDFSSSLSNSGFPLGSPSNPIKIGYAGLLMASKGVHTLINALIYLHENGYSVHANLAGADFQPGYSDYLTSLLPKSLSLCCSFLGHLDRNKLSRFWQLHHIGVFPSIYPEAFGISAAEIMASGLALLSTGVGGAKELFEDKLTGIRFLPDDPLSLANSIIHLISRPDYMCSIALAGKKRAVNSLSVQFSASSLADLFYSHLNGDL